MAKRSSRELNWRFSRSQESRASEFFWVMYLVGLMEAAQVSSPVVVSLTRAGILTSKASFSRISCLVRVVSRPKMPRKV